MSNAIGNIIGTDDDYEECGEEHMKSSKAMRDFKRKHFGGV